MKPKVIAIGNILMKDDGIGIRIAETIKDNLEECGLEVIIGETDFEYCISKIEEGDFIYILDASYSDKIPGELTVVPIENYRHEGKQYSQHGYSFLNMIFLYYKNIKGYIIGVEISEIDYDLNLSDDLSGNLKEISENVLKKIMKP